MGLVLLGADNLASDQADQNPSVTNRSKEGSALPWPKPWIEKVKLGGGKIKAIFHFYSEWPEADWTAAKTSLGGTLVEVDMSESSFDTIGTRAFYQQTQLKKVAFPKNLGTIKEYAFYQCSALEVNALPDSVFSIEKYVFYYSSVSLSKLPNSLKTLGANAFGHSSITINKIPSNVELVGENAFSACPIKNIEIAAKELDAYPFQGCTQLEKAWFRSTCEKVKAIASIASTFRMCPADLEIYAEPNAKPDGWDAYYNYTSNNPAVAVTVVYGQTTSPF